MSKYSTKNESKTPKNLAALPLYGRINLSNEWILFIYF